MDSKKPLITWTRLQNIQDPNYDFYPVYIDLQGTPENKFFATIAEDIFSELAPHLGDETPSPSLDGDYRYRDFVQDLRRVIRTLQDASPKQVKLILLMDEVDELNDYDRETLQFIIACAGLSLFVLGPILDLDRMVF